MTTNDFYDIENVIDLVLSIKIQKCNNVQTCFTNNYHIERIGPKNVQLVDSWSETLHSFKNESKLRFWTILLSIFEIEVSKTFCKKKKKAP